MRIVTVGGDDVGFFAVGQEAVGIIALGQVATGVIAVGQLATGVLAIGQGARGVVAIGQVAVGLIAVGMGAIGAFWALGMLSVAPTSSVPIPTNFGLFGRVNVAAVFNPHAGPFREGVPLPSWRVVMASLGTVALLAAWWLGVGQYLVLPQISLG